MYDKDLIESVLKHADIVNVISSYINVIHKGKNAIAICPFHDDKNPSLNISTEKQIYKCFSCGEGGNAISFVRNYEHVSFDEAVRKVAELSNYEDPRLVSQREKVFVDPEKEPLYKAMEDLNSYYQYALTTREGERARAYLKGRNIPSDQIEKFQIGYAPLDGKATVAYLQAKKHSLKTIEDIGIAFAQLEGTSDRNAGRLIFPLFNPLGRVVGFSARRLQDDGTSKYINSPETKIFHKGETLYNYHNDAKIARHEGYIYLLEGFMDVMALSKCGLPAIALCGTALTKEQIELLKRLHVETRVCLDGDAPGQIGMMKILSALQKERVPFRLVSNPGDLRDPDDILQESGVDVLKEMMGHLVDPSDFALSFYLNTKKLETIEDREKVLRKFLPYCAALPPGIQKENYLAKLSKATSFEIEAIRALLKDAKKAEQTPENHEHNHQDDRYNPEDKANNKRLFKAERTILYYMLRESEAVSFFEDYLGDFYYPDNDSLANYILDYASSHEGKVEPSQLLGTIQSTAGNDAENLEDYLNYLYEDQNQGPYSKKTLEQCKTIIEQEKKGLRMQKRAEETFATNDKKAQAEFIASIAKERYKDWQNRKQKK